MLVEIEDRGRGECGLDYCEFVGLLRHTGSGEFRTHPTTGVSPPLTRNVCPSGCTMRPAHTPQGSSVGGQLMT